MIPSGLLEHANQIFPLLSHMTPPATWSVVFIFRRDKSEPHRDYMN